MIKKQNHDFGIYNVFIAMTKISKKKKTKVEETYILPQYFRNFNRSQLIAVFLS